MKRHRISAEDRARVTRAIKQAEAQTSGEIIAVATRQSDDYVHVPLHIAAAVALAVPFVLPLLSRFFPWSQVPMSMVFLVQLVLFIVVALVLSIEALRYAVTPRSLMRKYAGRNAAFQFLAVNTHAKGRRTGILLFVSLLERHVEVIADTGIAAKVEAGAWQEVVDAMLPPLRRGEVADAMVLGVDRCGALLAEHFPRGRADNNELPDHFVVID